VCVSRNENFISEDLEAAGIIPTAAEAEVIEAETIKNTALATKQEPKNIDWSQKAELAPRQSKSETVNTFIETYNREKPEVWEKAWVNPALAATVNRFCNQEGGDRAIAMLRVALVVMRLEPGPESEKSFFCKNLSFLISTTSKGKQALIYKKLGQAETMKLTYEACAAIAQSGASDKEIQDLKWAHDYEKSSAKLFGDRQELARKSREIKRNDELAAAVAMEEKRKRNEAERWAKINASTSTNTSKGNTQSA